MKMSLSDFRSKIIFASALVFACGCAGASSTSDDANSTGGDGGASATSSSGADGGAQSTGGGSSSDVCTWSACGGDPVGSWTYSSACTPVTETPGSCSGSTTGSRIYLTGTLNLGADGKAHVDTTTVQETIIYYPKECWAPGATKCEDFVQAPDFDLHCVNTATDCTCTIVDSMANGPSDDTFTNQDGHIVLSDGTDFTFCADAEHLLLIHDTGEETFLDAAQD